MFLAGDIGGTKTVMALYERTGDGLTQLREEVYPSQEHATLEEIIAKFLKGSPGVKIDAGCWGVAGAVIAGKCQTTNLPWKLDENALAAAIGAPRGKLLNDLEAAAYGMLHLREDEFCVLNPGATPARQGNIAVIAAGTGLGEAILFWDGKHHHPSASEGGHSDFAPRSDLEIELLRHLRQKFGGHVSCERILSGPGFANLFEFLREGRHAVETPALQAALAGGQANVVVTQMGLAGSDPLCVKTLEMFAELYGAEAGNLTVKCMAVGGVYIGGGIAPKMLPALQNGNFLRGFLDKGRFRGLMESIPVKVALNPRAPLIGAAHYALRLV